MTDQYDPTDVVESRLNALLTEIKAQTELKKLFSPDQMPFDDWISFVDELINLAGEYAVAYESIVATLEITPFLLTGPTAVKFLEVALLMQYKTDRPNDSQFDFRNHN